MEFCIAAWAALQSNVTCDKLNLLLRAQEIRIDDHALLRPISYSWKWLKSVYLFQKIWSWYELVRAEKRLMTCMELIKCTCSFCVFNWQHSARRCSLANSCVLACLETLQPLQQVWFDSYRCWLKRGHLRARKSSFCGRIPPTTSS